MVSLVTVSTQFNLIPCGASLEPELIPPGASIEHNRIPSGASLEPDLIPPGASIPPNGIPCYRVDTVQPYSIWRVT